MSEPTTTPMTESEIQSLKAEVERLRAQADQQQQERSTRTRSVVSWIIAVLAILALTLAATTVWTYRTLNNTDLFVDRVGSVIEEPEVVAEISEQVSTAIVDGLDLQTQVAEALPEEAAILAAPITEAARSFIQDATERLVSSEQFRAAWDTALAASHTIAIQVLKGDTEGAVTLEEGELTVNLVPVINEVIQASEEFLSELFNREIDIPDVTEDQVDEAVVAIEEQFDVQVPADFGQITVISSEDLAAAQNAYQAATVAAWLAPIIGLVLAGLAIAISVSRLRMALSIVVGTALGLLFVGLALNPLQSLIVGLVPEEGLADAVGAAFDSLFSSLVTGILVFLVLGVIAAFVLFLTGRSDASKKAREAASHVPAQAGRNRPLFVVGGVVGALLLLWLIPGRGFGPIIVVLLLLAAYLLAVFLAPAPPEEEAGVPSDTEAEVPAEG